MNSPDVRVYAADSRRAVNDAALVLTAVGINHIIEQHPNGWSLLVSAQDQSRAHHQLLDFWDENQPKTLPPVEAPIVDSGWPGVVGYLFVIWFIPALASFSTLDFLSLGRLDAGAFINGDLWRAATALTLHADIAHITSNSIFGCVFGLFVGRYLGSGVGWLLVLVCGILANSINALIQPDSFMAIGASTATFAALGIVPAYGWRRGFFRGRGFTRGFAPLFAAIALLVFTGFGGENVDIMGHILGFICGIAMGFIVCGMDPKQVTVTDQQRAGAGAFMIAATAWLFAVI